MDYFCAWCKSQRTLKGYTTIITGSNTGIGKATALDLAKRGARVVMACRNINEAEKAKQEILEQNDEVSEAALIIEKLDLSSLTSVRECATRILAREKNINILINNAGVMMSPKKMTEDGFEMHIGINHFGHALFTLLLLPRIIKSAPSRIVTVSSFGHVLSNFDLDDINIERSFYHPMKAYCRSKSANIMFSRALHLKLREQNIQDVNTYSLHPGVVKTELARHLNETIIFGTTWIYNNIISWLIRSPSSGAQTTIYCAVDETCANESGLYYSNCRISQPYWQCRKDDAALRLWDLTIHSLGIQNYNPFTVTD